MSQEGASNFELLSNNGELNPNENEEQKNYLNIFNANKEPLKNSQT